MKDLDIIREKINAFLTKLDLLSVSPEYRTQDRDWIRYSRIETLKKFSIYLWAKKKDQEKFERILISMNTSLNIIWCSFETLLKEIAIDKEQANLGIILRELEWISKHFSSFFHEKSRLPSSYDTKIMTEIAHSLSFFQEDDWRQIIAIFGLLIETSKTVKEDDKRDAKMSLKKIESRCISQFAKKAINCENESIGGYEASLIFTR